MVEVCQGHRYQMREFQVAKYKTIWATYAHSHTIVLECLKYKMNINNEYVNEENKHIFWAKSLQIIYVENPTSEVEYNFHFLGTLHIMAMFRRLQ